MIFSDETLMAYVDGELDSEARAAVTAAITADPQVAQRITRHQTLRASLQAGFAHVLDEPVPERLLHVARTAPAGVPANVRDLATARAARAQSPPLGARLRGLFPQWGAIAASLIVGVIVGQYFLGATAEGPLVTQAGRLLARGALAQALSLQLASTQAQNSTVQIGTSFRARSGEYCRTFSYGQNSNNPQALAGLACREQGAWRIEVVASSAAGAPSGYRMASTVLPGAVAQAMDEKIAGEPLDARGEAAARQQGWQP